LVFVPSARREWGSHQQNIRHKDLRRAFEPTEAIGAVTSGEAENEGLTLGTEQLGTPISVREDWPDLKYAEESEPLEFMELV
jgi:hypothetical protein